jgi:hypothetical protein
MRTVSLSTLLLAFSWSASACTVAEFEIKLPKFAVGPAGTVRTVGEVVSRCSQATSIALTLTYRGKDGGVVGVTKAWIGPQRIAARGSLPFDSLASTVERPAKVEPSVQILD